MALCIGFTLVLNAQNEEPVVTAEIMPAYPGCEDLSPGEIGTCTSNKIHEFIAKNIVYPEISKENGVEGRVIAKMIIEKDGSVSNIEIIRKVDPALDSEAIRVLKSLPKFRPGQQHGEAVRVMYNIPIYFKLDK